MAWLIGLWVVAFAAQAGLLGANMWGLVVLSDLEVQMVDECAKTAPHLSLLLSQTNTTPSLFFPSIHTGRHDESARFRGITEHLDGEPGPRVICVYRWISIFAVPSQEKHPRYLIIIFIFIHFSQKPEYALQAALAALFLLSGHWAPGLVHSALAALHARALKRGEAGIDVTEIFKQAPAEKRRRAWRLGLYLLTFIYIIYRLVEAAVHALLTPDGKALAQELLHQAAATI
jgi:hypothetical protein